VNSKPCFRLGDERITLGVKLGSFRRITSRRYLSEIARITSRNRAFPRSIGLEQPQNAVVFGGWCAGPLKQARLLEPLALLWISLARKQGLGTNIAFRLMRR
jgi:hypothetical protein